MASSRGSLTTEDPVVLPSRLQSRSTSGSSLRAPNASSRPVRSRALASPIDASLALWGEGRRERVAELEEEICRQDDEQRRQRRQRRQQQQQGGSGSAEAVRDGGQEEINSTPSAPKSSAAPGKAAPGKAAESSRATPHSGAGSGAPPPPPPPPQAAAKGGVADRVASSNTSGPSSRTVGGGRSLSSARLLEERLGRWDAGWRPPALRELPRGGEGFFSGWSHLGQPERFELVKSVNRSVGADGHPLSDAELEWAVLCLEEAEERMAALDFSTAAGVLERVLGRCPGLTLAYYRLALCLLAARGPHGSRQARLLLDCAVSLEGSENRHLSAGVDLVLRILRNDAIPEAYWSEDYPRSLGDLRALEAAVDHLM